MSVRYKPIPGHEEYLVGDDGTIYNVRLKRNVRMNRRNSPYEHYLQVAFNDYRAGTTKTMLVHRIVAEAFCERKEGQKFVHHINGNKRDNRAANLMWVSQKEHTELHEKLTQEKCNAV